MASCALIVNWLMFIACFPFYFFGGEDIKYSANSNSHQCPFFLKHELSRIYHEFSLIICDKLTHNQRVKGLFCDKVTGNHWGCIAVHLIMIMKTRHCVSGCGRVAPSGLGYNIYFTKIVFIS